MFGRFVCVRVRVMTAVFDPGGDPGFFFDPPAARMLAPQGCAPLTFSPSPSTNA